MGAVSREVAEQMAVGVCRTLGTTWGLSVTGVAGPGGGTADKQVGLVYLGLAQAEGPVTIVECRWNPSQGRDWIRQVTIQEALDRLRHALA